MGFDSKFYFQIFHGILNEIIEELNDCFLLLTILGFILF
jgi:hypothetical protein